MSLPPGVGHFPKRHEMGLDSQQNSFWGTGVSPQQRGHPFSFPVTPFPCPKSLSDQHSPYKPNLFTAKSSVTECQGSPWGSPEQAHGQRKAKEHSHAAKFLRIAEN